MGRTAERSERRAPGESNDRDPLVVQETLPSIASTSPGLLPGTRINQYEVIKLLGEGGMGTVFLARDLRLGRRVAIKFLQIGHPEHTKLLLTEARATARCQHENIVVIYEVGEHGGMPYLVLEYLDGKALSAFVENEQRLPVARAVEIMCSILRALACAHEAGIVHRDLKPGNVVVTDAGAVKVFDFGIAQVSAHEPVLGPTGAAADDEDSDIGAGGTVPYMAPEQWGIGVTIDHRTDLWACGILLHLLVCGTHPLQPRQLVSVAEIDLPMPSMAAAAPPGVPRELIEIVDRCLRKPKDERWQSASEMLAALSPLLPGRRAVELLGDECPYAGLASFQESDAGKFFGRNHEIAELTARLRDRPLIAVVGSSGVGKSSFVRAGVIPALKRSGEPWEAMVVRPGRGPLDALVSMIQPMVATAANLADEVEEHRKLVETLRREPGHLGNVLRHHARREGRHLLLFLDQFEELYTQVAEPAERAAFTACLAAVADDATSPLRVVLSIRSDFFDRVAEDRRFAGELAKGLFLLGRPAREGLRDAIANPAEMAGYRLEPAIVDDMIDHLEATPGALPLLQFAAARLWDARDRARRLLTHASYTVMGGVAGALASHADRVVIDFGPQKAPLCRAIFLRLVTPERTRAIVPLAELRELSREPGEVQALLDQLVDARLLVVQTLHGAEGATVEIVHESLVHGWPTLQRWLDENQDDAVLVEQLRTAARQWDAKGRDPGLLWRGDALTEYERWRERQTGSPTPLEVAFGAASMAAVARGRRIRRAIVAAAIAISTVFFIFLWRANVAANLANREAEGLLRDSYFEQGRLRVLEGDKRGALAPLVTAYRMGSSGTPTRFLLEEAARPARARLLTLKGHTDKVWSVAFSPDGRWIATASNDHTARIWDAATGAMRAVVQHAGEVYTLAFSPDSRFMASGGKDPTVHVWDTSAGREIAALPASVSTNHLSFSPDASMLLTASNQGPIKLWQIPSGKPAGELPQWNSVRLGGATFCETGACIVAWDLDKLVVWDRATLEQRASYHVGSGQLYTAAVSRTGALLAIGTRSGELVLLRGDGTEIARRAAHDELFFDIAISPDESLVATGSDDRTARLWSAAGEPRGVLSGHRAGVTRVRFTPAGDRLVTTSADSTARVWSTSGMLLGELTSHTDVIMTAAVRSDGKHLATGSWDHTAMVWDLARAEEFRPVLTARDGAPSIVDFDARGDRLAIARAGGTLSVVDVHTGAAACNAESTTPIDFIGWVSSEEIAMVRAGGKAVEIRDTRRCAVTRELEHPDPITAMSTQPGARIVTATKDVVRVWNRGGFEAKLTGYPGTLYGVGIDGDDVYAFSSDSPTVVVDTVGVPERRRSFRAGTQSISYVRLDRAQGRVLATSADQSLYIWDAATGVLVRKLEGTGPLLAVRTSSDGKLTIGVGGVAPRIWDGASGALIGQLEGHSHLVRNGEFIDDALFVSFAWDHTAIVWDVAAARPLTMFRDVDKVAVSGDRRSVALVGMTGVRIWSPEVPAPDLDALRAVRVK